jgi:hypothetical protein
MHVKGISPKLAAAIGPPLTAVVTAMILTNTVDRTSLAALAAIAVGAVLGYHAPVGATTTTPLAAPMFSTSSSGAGTNIIASPVFAPDTDGDTMLEPELADKKPMLLAPPDEVDSPEQTQRSLS